MYEKETPQIFHSLDNPANKGPKPSMPNARTLALTSLALLAFAANSLLCRLALRYHGMDAAGFTFVRLASGAATLWLLTRIRARPKDPGLKSGGNWVSGFALFVYAAGFSLAYAHLSAATGALILFGAVQITMIGTGLGNGERLRPVQLLGLALTLGGLVGLLLPGLSAPPLLGSALMLLAGSAWGVYSLRGKGAVDPAGVTAGNFMRAVPFAMAALALSAMRAGTESGGAFAAWNAAGVAYAVFSGALASGIGYVVWYAALPGLKATQAATVQLSVPVLASLGGAVFLDESLTVRWAAAATAILGGIALVILEKQRAPRAAV